MLDRALDTAVDLLLVTATVLLALALAPRSGPYPSAAPPGPERAAVLAAIDRLPQAVPDSSVPYDRAQFPHWIEVTPGCDTRCVVLDRQRSPAGWRSAYDGYTATTAGELEIDHVVPLAEAWVSGAAGWEAPRRRAFANDLASGQLLAVTAWSNRAKGASDPAAWRPPDRTWWCAYAATWVDVKSRWQLTADAAEIAALREMAQRCRPGGH